MKCYGNAYFWHHCRIYRSVQGYNFLCGSFLRGAFMFIIALPYALLMKHKSDSCGGWRDKNYTKCQKCGSEVKRENQKMKYLYEF